MNTKKILKMIVLIFGILSVVLNIYLKQKLNKKDYLLEQTLRVKIENDITIHYLLSNNKSELINGIIVNDLRIFRAIMREEYGREFSIPKHLDSLTNK